MKETFEKVNDYTLRVDQTLESKDDSIGYAASSQHTNLTRLFNFEAAQITTIVKASSLIAKFEEYFHLMKMLPSPILKI